GDGFGTGSLVSVCYGASIPSGYSTNNTDCNDGNASLNSISPETCNSFDDDCDGTVDNGLNFVNYYNDADGDGYGAGTATSACAQPANTVTNNSDCAPTDNTKWQTADRYVDADGDGFGTGSLVSVCYGASIPSGYSTNNTDCNDNDATLNSITAETCNSFDDDCDGTVDNGLTFVNYYNDQDGDGYGAGTATNACSQPVNTVTNNSDCAPTDNTKWQTADRYVDADGDGYGTGTLVSVCYGASIPSGYSTNNTDCNDNDATLNSITAETCNSFDDDCDGIMDNGLPFVDYYSDQDGDGYGAGTATNACSQPANTVTNNSDCAPTDNTKWQTADRYVDADGDGFGTGSLVSVCY
ncbi:MAG: hypothetical protein EBV23_14625, partial [Flavobacteriia bacterium]|nr:hypothetical protein [Flavobacteriia bacterium]